MGSGWDKSLTTYRAINNTVGANPARGWYNIP